MKKICAESGQPFEVTDADKAFYKKVAPKVGSTTFEIPFPTLSPVERQRRRLVWWNERALYKRRCDATGEEVISQYTADVPFPVYGLKYYFDRQWQPPEREFDFSRPFFEQFAELLAVTPQAACLTDLTSMEHNSVFQNASSRNKNCYLVFSTGDCEDCLYGSSFDYCKNCLDSLFVRGCEWCYECIDCVDCYQLFFSQNCKNCSTSAFLLDCRGCTDCFGCVGLRQKQYCFFNEQLTKEEYTRKVKEIMENLTPENIAHWQKKFDEFAAGFPRRDLFVEQSENCDGNFVYNSKNVHDSYMVYDSEDCRYCWKVVKSKDCYDLSAWGDPGELCYECSIVGKSPFRCFFSNNCWPECREILYCDSCSVSSNLFGCAGLYRAEYRILNKQYTQKEYEALVPKIVEHMKKTGEWGEFFPVPLCPFPYNNTVANDYFPLTKAEVLKKGWKWVDESEEEVADDILDTMVKCEATGKLFKLQKQELDFYRRMGLPVPRFHPTYRGDMRMKRRKLFV